MMKILINAVSAKSGGAPTYIKNLISLVSESDMANSGYEYVFCISSRLAKEIGSLPSHLSLLITDVGYRATLLRFLWDQLALRRIIKKIKADILISSSDFGMFFPPVKQILMLRNPLFCSEVYLKRFLPQKSLVFKLIFYLKRWLVFLSVRYADTITIASYNMLSDVSRFIFIPKEKIFVNPFGVALKRFKTQDDTINKSQIPGIDTLKILYISEYSDYKNLTTLLESVIILVKQDRRDFSVLTTLDPWQFPDIEITSRRKDQELALCPSILNHIKFMGSVGYEKIHELYQASDLFIFPSLAESFGHPLVEAMACGLPIIASDIPICREICAEAAVYFSPQDPKDLAEKIIRLRNDFNLRIELGRMGRRRAEMYFDWKHHLQRLIEVFEKVSKGSGHKS